MPYQHFNTKEQYVISHMVLADFSLRKISRELGRHHTSISREIARNRSTYADDAVYWYDAAEYYAKERRHKARHRRRQHERLVTYVTAKLKLDWSPEAIAGRLQVDYPDNEKGEGALVTSVTYSQCILIYYFLDVLLGSSPESNDMAGSFIKAFTLSTYN